MSILIKGMKMPREGLSVVVDLWNNGKAYVYGAGNAEMYDAVELPDHGDLVDVRWLLSEYQNVCYGMSCDECKLAAKDIRGGQLVITGCALEDFFAVAPVIISAERSDNGET